MKNTMEKGVFARGGAVLSKENALLSAMKMGVDFDKDFHAQSYGNELAELAKKVRYRKSKTSSGSLGRAFFEHLQKIYDKNPSKYKDLVKSFSEGGSIGFKGLSAKVAKRYAGKKVAPKYQGEYGKRYSKSEAKEVGDKVAGKVYWQQQGRKMAKGGGIYSSDSMYELKVFDGKSNELLTTKRFRARNQREANELGQDYEYEMQQKYGDYLRFEVSEAKPLMAMGGEISNDVKVFSVEKMRTDPTLKRKMAMGFYIPIFNVGEKTAFGFIETPKSVIEEGKAMSNVKAVKYKNGKIKLVFGQNHYSRGGNVNEGGELLQEISTHKAVKKGDKIYIYIKGMPIKNAEDRSLAKQYPHWFKDELIRTIPAENEDDLFYIFENYEEENRSNLSGYARGGNVNTGRAWRLDRAKYNKSESYETPYASRKRKFEDGGQIGQEIVFDDNGEENSGVIKDITNLGDYVVKADDGRTLLAQRELDVISLGAMRLASTEAPRKRFGFFKDGGGVEKPKYYVEWLEDGMLKSEIYNEDEYEGAKELYYQIKYDLFDSQYKRPQIFISDYETGEVVFGDEFEYAKGGGVDYPNHYLEFEDLKRKINSLEQQIEADYRNDEIDSYTHRNEMELERLEQKLELLMLGRDSYSDGGAVDDGFYVGQTIKLIDRNNFYGKTSKDIKKMISPYVNVELVIEEIIINKPHNMAKAYLKSNGEKVPFDIVLNKKYIETFAEGGGVSGLDDLIRG